MGHLKRREPVDRFRIRSLDWTGLSFLMVAVLMASVAGSTARAAASPTNSKSPFGITGGFQSGASAQAASEPTLATTVVNRAWSWLLFEQHRLTQDMTGAVRDLKSTTSVASATGALLFVSFVYGVLHAAGPGHGKAVISSYMLADKETLRRGMFAIWAGILATFAMALGTAIAVSALAALAVGSRNLAITLAGSKSHWGATIAKGASIASSATVFVLGTAFFVASLHSTRPF